MNEFINKHKFKILAITNLLFLGIIGASAVYIFTSDQVSYDNEDSGMSSNNVQDAIDELYGVARFSDRMDELEEALGDYWTTIYPVGSIYTSISSTRPQTIFGGTWVSFGSGKTLVGVDTSQSEFNTVEKTGGKNSHQHIYGIAFAARWGDFCGGEGDTTTGVLNGNTGLPTGWTINNSNGLSSGRENTGNSGAARTFPKGANRWESKADTSSSSLQPYITVYMWKRTA